MGCLEDEDRYRRGLRRTSGTSLGMLSLSLVVDDGGVGGKEKPKSIVFFLDTTLEQFHQNPITSIRLDLDADFGHCRPVMA